MIDLIWSACAERRPARLKISHDEMEAFLFFEGGDLVHVDLGAFEGQGALDEVLQWPNGAFELKHDIPAPTRTLSSATLPLPKRARLKEIAVEILEDRSRKVLEMVLAVKDDRRESLQKVRDEAVRFTGLFMSTKKAEELAQRMQAVIDE